MDFARLAADLAEPGAVLPLLARVAVERVGADGALVLAITDSGEIEIRAAHDVPVEVVGVRFDEGALDSQDDLLLRACGGGFSATRQIPIASAGRLYGALAILSRGSRDEGPDALGLAEALCDLAAVTLDRRFREETLRRSHQDLAEAERTLARTERLRTLGQMSAGIAHDLKNLFNPLQLQVQLARRRGVGDTPHGADLLGRVENVVKRGIDIFERLRSFSRQAPEKIADTIDVSPLVREAVELARARTHRHSVVLELDAGGRVRGSSSEFVSAVLNLIVNAADAMPEGGTITLRAGRAERCVFVEVADDGPGMPPEVEAHIFEPFFTTKGEEGTGLGLPTIYAFVQRTGGRISLETQVGKGTTFRLEFPPHDEVGELAPSGGVG